MSNNSEKNKETIDNFLGSIKDFRPEFKSLNYEKDDIENYLMNNYNYILTDKAKERLNKLYTYISNGIPVLLEGETGTSKTLSFIILINIYFDVKNKNLKNIYTKIFFFKLLF